MSEATRRRSGRCTAHVGLNRESVPKVILCGEPTVGSSPYCRRHGGVASDPGQDGIRAAREQAQALTDAIDDALEIQRTHEAAAAADAGFDAGEWSGPAHAQMIETALDDLCERHGVSREALDTALLELSQSARFLMQLEDEGTAPDFDRDDALRMARLGDAIMYRCPDCGTTDPFDHSMGCQAPVPDPDTVRGK